MSDMSGDLTWILSGNRKTIRMQLPPLPIEGMAEPLRIHIDFDADAVDGIVERLLMMRSQMLPAAVKQ